MSDGVGRRALLAAVSGATVGLAGCAGLFGGGGTDDPEPTTSTATSTPTPTDDGTPSESGDTPTASATPVFPGYETTRVSVRTPDGEALGSVTAAIADTGELRYTGLSETPSMPADRGMLFVYGAVEERTFVMRRMDFPLDMVFADGDGRITVIHQAPPPGPEEDGNDIRRSGRAQYVLELNRGWCAERGVEAGDVLSFDLP